MSMDKNAADAYVYAKASGMLARSYVGKNARKLFDINSLSELWSLLFKTEVPVIPEKLLAKKLEEESEKTFIREYIKLIDNYSSPSPVLLALLHYFDYDNLKEIGSALSFGEKELPSLVDISPFNIIDYSKWPDIQKITKSGNLSWYNRVPSIKEQKDFNAHLDSDYLNEVWSAASSIKTGCRDSVLDLLGEKFRIDNILWALRLRVYYNMDKTDIIEHLAYSDNEKRHDDPLVVDAVKTLDWDTDSYDQWKNWKYAYLLNPYEEGSIWNIDPRWIYNAYKKRYVQKAKRMFHQFPFTECPLVCFFILKQNELDNIRTASESICLNISQSQAMELTGVSEVKNG